tara:strand:+ start:5542 stop:6870 length:1329 start_codon:yes stop_codon:yes gene_type:complete
MLLSSYFLPVLKEVPSEAQIVSHQLMLRAGMIRQTSAGIYSFLPLGLKVLKKIENIIREEQDRAGAVEMLMPTIQSSDLWKESGRYDDYGQEMLRIKDRHDREMLYGPTNEEMITDIVRSTIKSYKDLPKNLYHIQWKFRDEIRPRFGVMRGREFLMKDNYSFDLDEASARISYQKMYFAYLKTFARMGIKAIPMKADTGPIGGDLSHEFIVLAQTGESDVFVDNEWLEFDALSMDINYNQPLQDQFEKLSSIYAATDEMHDETTLDEDVKTNLISTKGIEVGHIFYFGTKYSKAMNTNYMGSDGQNHLMHMGSYGIGVSRLIAAIIEAHHDENGIIWPQSVAPFDLSIINLKPSHESCDKIASEIYQFAKDKGLDPLMDDTDNSIGAKFATMDLIGLPYQIAVGPKTAGDNKVEFKCRKSGKKEVLDLTAAKNRIVELFGL